ncbi:MAG: ABC transporter permease [Phototrophicaceae bacterium]
MTDNIANLNDSQSDVRPRDNMWLETLKSLLRNNSARAGLVILSFLLFIYIFAPVLAPYEPTEILLDRPNGIIPRLPPCLELFGCDDGPQFVMGLDGNGRDIYSRVLYGSRLSLPVGLAAVSISITFGSVLGLLAGFYGGWIDNLIMRVMDVLLAFPSLLLAIAIVTVLGPGLINALIAIAIVAIPTYARLVRASVLSLKEQEFVLAARALGTSNRRIMFSQILPNSMTPIVVQGTLGIGTAVLDAAALSFLGLGAQPPSAEWGRMLGDAIDSFRGAPHMAIFPGVAIMLTVLGFNLLGDGLRDALDPRLNKS